MSDLGFNSDSNNVRSLVNQFEKLSTGKAEIGSDSKVKGELPVQLGKMEGRSVAKIEIATADQSTLNIQNAANEKLSDNFQEFQTTSLEMPKQAVVRLIKQPETKIEKKANDVGQSNLEKLRAKHGGTLSKAPTPPSQGETRAPSISRPPISSVARAINAEHTRKSQKPMSSSNFETPSSTWVKGTIPKDDTLKTLSPSVETDIYLAQSECNKMSPGPEKEAIQKQINNFTKAAESLRNGDKESALEILKNNKESSSFMVMETAHQALEHLKGKGTFTEEQVSARSDVKTRSDRSHSLPALFNRLRSKSAEAKVEKQVNNLFNQSISSDSSASSVPTRARSASLPARLTTTVSDKLGSVVDGVRTRSNTIFSGTVDKLRLKSEIKNYEPQEEIIKEFKKECLFNEKGKLKEFDEDMKDELNASLLTIKNNEIELSESDLTFIDNIRKYYSKDMKADVEERLLEYNKADQLASELEIKNKDSNDSEPNLDLIEANLDKKSKLQKYKKALLVSGLDPDVNFLGREKFIEGARFSKKIS